MGLGSGGYMPALLGRPIRTFLALSVTAATLTAVSPPARAGDGGAVAAGILGGTALCFGRGSPRRKRAAAPATGLLRASLCCTAAAALLVRAAGGVDRLR